MTSETHQHRQSGLSARLSYSDFEVAIKAFLHQTRHHTPWSYVEYSVRTRGHCLAIYLFFGCPWIRCVKRGPICIVNLSSRGEVNHYRDTLR